MNDTGSNTSQQLCDSQSGLAVIEWILLLLVMIIPMAGAIYVITKAVVHFYSVTGWVVGLPFP